MARPGELDAARAAADAVLPVAGHGRAAEHDPAGDAHAAPAVVARPHLVGVELGGPDARGLVRPALAVARGPRVAERRKG